MFFLLPKRQISNKGFQMFFNCIVHDLLLTKLSAYGSDCNLLELINSFLSIRKFRTKKGSSCSLITNMVVSEGSFWGPFLYTYTCAIFFYAIVKGSVRYIFTSLFCMSKREDLWNKEKCFLFHFESSFRSWDNQILNF